METLGICLSLENYENMLLTAESSVFRNLHPYYQVYKDFLDSWNMRFSKYMRPCIFDLVIPNYGSFPI